MLGILRSYEGEIRILSMDGRRQRREILSQVGYMPSEAMFYPSMKVKDVIRLAADARGRDCEKEAEKICVRLEVNTEKRIRELSLGNRKKVSIVCAMQHKPRLLVLDEPTSGLDPLMQEVFFELICEYNRQGTTCFLSSHVLPEVNKYCRNAAFIRDGKIIRTDSVENLSRSGLRRVRLWKQGREQRFDYTGETNGLLHKLAQGLFSVAQMKPEDVLIEEPSLDELFLHYYEEEKGGKA
jgi:ABC-2 type transport system ATP-binding protein